MMLGLPSRPPEGSLLASPRDDSARFMGVFLMALWAVAIVVFTGDMAASGGACTADCAWSGLSGIHAAMQGILLLAAVCTGAAGAGLWIGSAVPTPVRS